MAGSNSPKGIKFLVDFGPLVVFFVTYKIAGLMQATVALVIATVIALAIGYVATRRIALMPLITAVVVVIFGGLTWWFNDGIFIKMKPTIVQGIFAALLFRKRGSSTSGSAMMISPSAGEITRPSPCGASTRLRRESRKVR